MKDKHKFNCTGIWFFGLAGSGKTFASSIIGHQTKKSYLIDGHEVRKLISCDLGYSKHDRDIQLNRLFGIANLTIKNGFFPVVASVSMQKIVLEKCNMLGIRVIKIERSFEQISRVRSIYKSSENVVGKDLFLDELETTVLFNDGTSEFASLIKSLVR